MIPAIVAALHGLELAPPALGRDPMAPPVVGPFLLRQRRPIHHPAPLTRKQSYLASNP
jgi:hypothetical protein